MTKRLPGRLESLLSHVLKSGHGAPGNSAADAESPWNTTTFYSSDQIGSEQMLSAGGNWPVSSDTYYPFGQEAYPSGDNNHYKFTGKERDIESGLDYFGARYYVSGIGRFMSADWSAQAQPVPYASLEEPQTLNLFAYVKNNPISLVDPNGHWVKPDGAFYFSLYYPDDAGNMGTNERNKEKERQAAQQQNSNLSPMDKVAMKAEVGALKLTRQALAGGHAAEYGGLILKRNADGSLSATAPIHTGETSVNIDSIAVPRGYTAVGEYHTHPSVDCCESEGPSTQDINRLRTPELASRIGYVGSAFTGEVRRYTQREPITSMYDTHTYGTVIGTIP
jgi:RHS repeat-associated protein